MNTILKLTTGLVSLCFLGNAIANGSCTNENTAIPYSTPSSDFTLHDNGTVTHNTTGLMWMRCSIGQTWEDESCTGDASGFTWQQALAQNGTAYAGYSDWRVPNKNELASILEQRCYNPSINEAIFPDTPANHFWSSSPYADYSNYALGVNVGIGFVYYYYKGNDFHVRLVRAR
ncbi:DUF1566 domain-containing protein [Pseudoalteromonas sp. NEC-BIFX-2020_015]|uniref:Lcl C-terminal domain-containing protein n=1 Tax=Pseudoalteromonas sp. NEC-BIFX-2020_015 TaxID=2729544 RepID=UPI00146140D5|nr:DUF1566 domain-containing protein [Pseudoalteromonas sp. NEC-BIFX-2020_015]NMR24406.1 DUF1566 domain-containing protein [Pseudoalteromonas sp. NEC-BIFX-2020_015]